jgi:type II restriction enzyme
MRMDLSFERLIPTHLSSGSQRARVLTERWVEARLYCPACGHQSLTRYPNNRPAADFACQLCDEDYELKSQRGRFGRKVLDGAYGTLLERLASQRNPNLLLLNYAEDKQAVTELSVVPKQLFVASMIEARPPLSASAKRAGWVGCRIILADLPESGRIGMVRAGRLVAPEFVKAAWNNLLFLRSSKHRGWLLRMMACVDRFGPDRFTLAQVYAFELEFAAAFPGNANVRPKMRQQMQVLRDHGYLRFLGNGVYERVAAV